MTRTISLAPYRDAPVGTNPEALSVSSDGSRLYVANAGDNDVAVVDLGSPKGRVKGLIPTGWYPTGVHVASDGKHLLVLNAKGLGAGPNAAGPNPTKDPESGPDQYIGSMIQGSLSVIATPQGKDLRTYTDQVRHNDGFDRGASVRTFGVHQHVVPVRPGDPSPIKHVIVMVNENRTYDQVLGDLGKGNGDPSITLFGPDIAPNHHALASAFTVLDNTYTVGEVSDDGWEWTAAGNANSFDQKTFPTNYGGRGAFYAGEGGTRAAAPGEIRGTPTCGTRSTRPASAIATTGGGRPTCHRSRCTTLRHWQPRPTLPTRASTWGSPTRRGSPSGRRNSTAT